MVTIGDTAAIGAGAVAGALCRYQIGYVFTRRISNDTRLSSQSVWHTAGINVFGSFVLGAIAGLPSVAPTATKEGRANAFILSPRVRLLTGVGFCGSFTTFSTFSVDVVNMLSKGDTFRAFSYMAVNNLGGIIAAFAGLRAMGFVVKKFQ
mmetsp:Transcript_25682/g.53068  ORF Transcript_25682/g.53068 Transcript_25682/m.53068 type:complete len:150 (-) Transcript_25682:46-495(-)